MSSSKKHNQFLSNDLSGYWKVHTVSLLKQSINDNSQMAIFAIPFQIFANLLYEVAERANELQDPKLCALMCRLTLFSEADPESPDYNPEKIKSLIRQVYPDNIPNHQKD